jgi:hypothetical protein
MDGALGKPDAPFCIYGTLQSENVMPPDRPREMGHERI